VNRALGHALGGGLGRRDDEHLGAGHELRNRQRHVAGAGRHVDQEEVGLAPVHVGEELLQGLVQHRAPPDDGLVLAGEEAHGDALHVVGDRRHDHLVDDHGRLVDAEHAGHREAVHVGIEDADFVAETGEGDGDVHRDRGLADAALAARDAEHARAGACLGEGDVGRLLLPLSLRLACLQTLPQRVALLVGHHAEGDVDMVDAVEGLHRVRDPVGELGAQRAAGDGEGDVDGDGGAVDVDATNHVEVDDAPVQLGILHGAKGLDDLGFGDGHDEWASGDFSYPDR